MEIAYIFKDDDVEVQITNRFTAFDVQLSKILPHCILYNKFVMKPIDSQSDITGN